MPKRKIRQGEDIVSICTPMGISWERAWQHGENASLRQERKSPHLLMPGDELFIPELEKKNESCGCEQKHTFVTKISPIRFRARLFETKQSDEKREAGSDKKSEYIEEPPDIPEEKSLANVPYCLYVDEVLLAEGKTDGEGFVDELIAASARKGQLVLQPGTENERKIELNWRHLNPPEEISGICQRLNNMGFGAPDDAKELTPEVKGAIRDFQKCHALEPTGELEEKTRKKIIEIYGS